MKKIFPFILIILNGILFLIFTLIMFLNNIVLKDNEKLIFKSGRLMINNNEINIFELSNSGLAFLSSSIIVFLLFILFKYNLINMIKSINIRKIFNKWIFFYALAFGIEYIIYNLYPNLFQNSIILNKSNINLIFFSLSIGLLVPIIEEYTFRVHLLDNFFIDKSNTYKILLTSIIFTAFHCTNNSLVLLCFIFIFSFISTSVYIKEKNITLPLFMHILNNMSYIFFQN